MDYLDNIQAQMRKGTLEFAILLVIEKGNVYANDILKELSGTKLIVVEGTLYPLLSRLRGHELVDYSWKESRSGPPRKYYTLTKKGKEALTVLKGSWLSLDSSIKKLTNTYGKNN